jgi:hypothetical protein
MPRPRLPLWGLMALVIYAAAGLAALRGSSVLWASVIFTATLAVLCIATLGAMATHGSERAAWSGLAVFGWAYLLAAFGPWPQNRLGPPPPLAGPLLDQVQDSVHGAGNAPYVTVEEVPREQTSKLTRQKGPATAAAAAVPPRWVDLACYRQIGQSLGAVLFGTLGALASYLLFGRTR